MRNLRNIHGSRVKSQKLSHCCWDVGTDSLICVSGPTKDEVLLQLKRWGKFERSLEPIASWDAPCPIPDLEKDEILSCQYFTDICTVCLVLAGGDLIVVREHPQDDENKIEIVGSVDAGISSAAWSPDEELLAITTRASTLLYMTRDFENVVDVSLTPEDLKVSNHVSVGWGKKETQFKGKKARALRDPTIPETVDEGVLHHLDSRNTTISWRGDGAYLAINSIENGVRRVIRVYSREGILDSVSEPVDHLVGALSWRPAGNIITGLQRLDDVAKIVFFERNGLRHGEFNLRLTKEDMVSWASDITLRWNANSSVLAVCFRDRIQLWTMGNYHYYLKQEIMCARKDTLQRPVEIYWNPEKPLHFASGTDEGVQRLAYAQVVSSSPTAPPNDYGVVAVIDGRKLKLTPMRTANVPPPMSLHELELDHNVTDVAMTCRTLDGFALCLAILHGKSLSLFHWPAHSLAPQAPSLLWQVSLATADSLSNQMSLQTAFGPHDLVSVLQKGIQKPKLRAFDMTGLPRFEGEVGVDGQLEILVAQRLGKGADAYFVANSRHLPEDDDAHSHSGLKSMPTFPVSVEYSSTETVDVVAYRQPEQSQKQVSFNGEAALPKMGATVDGSDPGEGPIFFRLDGNGCLYANERCLVRNCTSFLVTPAHLIFTISQHLLKFVHLEGGVDGLEVPPDTPESDERCRSIERGAKLVTVMPSTFALVLQMPRGNLETIYPRALVLTGIRECIIRMEYRKAFFACRNHRVDMNILYDYAPTQFLGNIGSFINRLKKAEYIDLFLSQLKEDDVSYTMYRETLRDDPTTETFKARPQCLPSNSKVNLMCDAFLAELGRRSNTYLQNIISAYVCKVPPDLDAGLSQISKLRRENSEQVDASVEHICFLADANKLYDNALGLYDLKLALLIAQQSQKDPREYLPFLQNLQNMSELRKQYSIDDFLGRHTKALRHLCELDAFEEVKSYAVKHSLYAQALERYRYQEAKCLELTRLHANCLQHEGKYREAGIAFECLKDHSSASESFRQANLWRESLSNASMNLPAHLDIRSLALSLAETLTESKEFRSAATIYLDHLSDVPTAARLFCKGYHFAEATRIVALHKRLDLLESVIDPGLVEGMSSMTDLLADCKSQLNSQTPRIRELRTKKAEDPLAFWDGNVEGGPDILDSISVAPTDTSTTGGSLFTRYTNQTGTVGTNATRITSKNRRREERKRARGKKGSVYEEEYLVNSVGRLIDRVNAVGDEVSRLGVGLMRRGMRERARAVESAMLETVDMCKRCVQEVFQSTTVDENVTPESTRVEINGYVPQGGDAVFLESLENRTNRREPPVVKDFKSLSLLGR